MMLFHGTGRSGLLPLLVLVVTFAESVLSAVVAAAAGDNGAAYAGQYLRRSLADEIVQTQRPLGLGTGLFAIVVFFFIFVIAFIAGIFLEKLRGALIGAGLCMLVTVTLFVALAPRGPKYVDDQVEGADGAGYNFLGRIQPALFCLLFMGVAAGGFGLFKFFLAEDMTASRHLRR